MKIKQFIMLMMKTSSVSCVILVLAASTILFSCTSKSKTADAAQIEELANADLFDMVLNFDGSTIKFPITVGEFQKITGWNIDYNLSQSVAPHSVITNRDLAFRSKGKAVFIEAGNYSGDIVKFADCQIVRLLIPDNNAQTIFGKKSCVVLFPKGIRFSDNSSTSEEIVAAYGDPDDYTSDFMKYSDGDKAISINFINDSIFTIEISTGGTTIYDLQ